MLKALHVQSADSNADWITTPLSTPLAQALRSSGCTMRAVVKNNGPADTIDWLLLVRSTYDVERHKLGIHGSVLRGGPSHTQYDGTNVGTQATGAERAYVYVYQPATAGAAGFLRCYRDGVQWTNVNIPAGTDTAFADGDNMRLCIARGGANGGNYDVLEIAVWDQALSASAIAEMDTPGTRRRLTNAERADTHLLFYAQPDDAEGAQVLPNQVTHAGATASLDASWSLVKYTYSSAPLPLWADPAYQSAPSSAPVLTLGATSQSNVSLSWTAVSGATSYTVKRNGTTVATGVTATSYNDTTVAPSTAYAYTVAAVNTNGTGPASNTVNVATPSNDTTNPTPGTLTLVSASFNSAVVSMGAGSDNVGVASRTLRVYSNSGLTAKVGADRVAVAGENTITGLSPETNYWIVGEWKDGVGNAASGAALPITTTAVTDFPVRVTALHHTVQISFDVRDVNPGLYSATVPAELTHAGRVRLWWSTDGVAWKQAQDMVRVHANRYIESGVPQHPGVTGQIWGLEAGATYHWRITFEGGTWPASLVKTGTVTTRSLAPPVGPTVTQVTVSEDETDQSLWTKVRDAYAAGADVVEFVSSHGPGVETRVPAAIASIYAYGAGWGGAYNWSGTANRWKSIRTHPDHRVIFDGGLPEYNVTGANKWTLYVDAAKGITAGMGIYKSATKVPQNLTGRIYYERPGEDVGIQLMDLTWGKTTNWAPTNGIDGSMQTRAGENGAAYAWVNSGDGTGYLYLRLHDATDPNTVKIKIAAPTPALDFEGCSYVKVENLDIRYRGNGSFMGGLNMVGPLHHLFITGCRLVCTNGYVAMQTQFESVKNHVTLYRNTFASRGTSADPRDQANPIPTPEWGWTKATENEVSGITARGCGWSILENTIQGTFNAMDMSAGQEPLNYDAGWMDYPDTSSRATEAAEIIRNTIIGVGDDAIEPEQFVFGLLFAENTFDACYKGISAAPVIGGPLYILRNKWRGRGEYDGTSDTQAFLKLGNDNYGDTGYKLIVNNTIVNINDDPEGGVLPGLMDSGGCYNVWIFNNYVASDWYPVDFGYGHFGYPQVFDRNRYRCTRPYDGTGRVGYAANAWGVTRRPVLQGDGDVGTNNRLFATFADWQRGGPAIQASAMPGYIAGTTPETPVAAMTAGFGAQPAQPALWLHDPHSTYTPDAGHELVAPDTGDFHPTSTVGWNAGEPLAGITFDVGPRWSAYEEPTPTIGAVPMNAAPAENRAPSIVNDAANLSAVEGALVTLSASVSDLDGDALTVTAAILSAPQNATPAPGPLVVSLSGGKHRASFSPDAPGIYTARFTASDGVATTQGALVTVTVSPVPVPATDEVATGGGYVYHVGDTLPHRRVELARRDGSAWLAEGDTVEFLDAHRGTGRVRIVPARIVSPGDGDSPSVALAPAPETSAPDIVRTRVRRVTADGGQETREDPLIWIIEA